MRLTTAERLQKLNNIQLDNILNTGIKKAGTPVLSFSPTIIVFQNFNPNEKVVAKFTVKNISKVSVYIKHSVYLHTSKFKVTLR